MFKLLNKVQSTLLVPLIVSSFLFASAEIFNIISDYDFSQSVLSVISSLSGLFTDIIPFLFCYFITLVLSKGKRGFKAFWSLICLSVTYACKTAFYQSDYSFVIGVIIALLCIYCFNNFQPWLSLSLTFAASVIFGVLFGFIGDYFADFIMWISDIISGGNIISSALFSAGDCIFSLFNINAFRDAFYTKSYGGSMLIDGEIITGITDLFASGYSGKVISAYLSGHYFMLFAVVGITAALFSQFKGAQRITLSAVSLGSVLSGNLFPFLLFTFLESPFLFLSELMINILSYITAYILDLSIGFLHNGSVIEMIININNPVYLFAGGTVFICIGFFVTKYVVEKHGISDCVNIYIPTRFNRLVDQLGGVANIVRFRGDTLEVRNPKLVNNLSFECEIEENTIKSKDELFCELKEYFNSG